MKKIAPSYPLIGGYSVSCGVCKGKGCGRCSGTGIRMVICDSSKKSQAEARKHIKRKKP